MQQHATNIVRELRQRGFQAYFAGGCVRDMLLGLEPTDYDVATDATPPEVMRIFPETYAVGAQFGVCLSPGARELSCFAERLLSTRTMSKLLPSAMTAPTLMVATLTRCVTRPIRGKMCSAAISP